MYLFIATNKYMEISICLFQAISHSLSINLSLSLTYTDTLFLSHAHVHAYQLFLLYENFASTDLDLYETCEQIKEKQSLVWYEFVLHKTKSAVYMSIVLRF